MKKVLAIYESGYADESNLFIIHSDIELGNEYVKELNVPYNEEYKILEKCIDCYGEDREEFEDNPYKFRNECSRACIKTDRNGEYCENELLSRYELNESHYYGIEMEMIE